MVMDAYARCLASNAPTGAGLCLSKNTSDYGGPLNRRRSMWRSVELHTIENSEGGQLRMRHVGGRGLKLPREVLIAGCAAGKHVCSWA